MKNLKKLAASALLSMAVLASPASAQFDFPYFALTVSGDGHGYFASGFATGVNDASGKTNAIGAWYGQDAASVSFLVGAGYLMSGVDELSLGGDVAFALQRKETSAISLQVGLDWIGFDAGLTTLNAYQIPVSVAWQGAFVSPDAVVIPFVAPRIQFLHQRGGGASDTSSDFGLAGGVSFKFNSGLAAHAALDFSIRDGGDPVHTGIALSYLLGG